MTAKTYAMVDISEIQEAREEEENEDDTLSRLGKSHLASSKLISLNPSTNASLLSVKKVTAS